MSLFLKDSKSYLVGPSSSCSPAQTLKEFKSFCVFICKTDRFIMNSSIINQGSNGIKPVNLFTTAFAISKERTDLTHLDFTIYYINDTNFPLATIVMLLFSPGFFY